MRNLGSDGELVVLAGIDAAGEVRVIRLAVRRASVPVNEGEAARLGGVGRYADRGGGIPLGARRGEGDGIDHDDGAARGGRPGRGGDAIEVMQDTIHVAVSDRRAEPLAVAVGPRAACVRGGLAGAPSAGQRGVLHAIIAAIRLHGPNGRVRIGHAIVASPDVGQAQVVAHLMGQRARGEFSARADGPQVIVQEHDAIEHRPWPVGEIAGRSAEDAVHHPYVHVLLARPGLELARGFTAEGLGAPVPDDAIGAVAGRVLRS